MHVECEAKQVTVQTDSGPRKSVQVTCSRCGRQETSFGTGDASIRRCLVMLRQNCDKQESNYYKCEPLEPQPEPKPKVHTPDLFGSKTKEPTACNLHEFVVSLSKRVRGLEDKVHDLMMSRTGDPVDTRKVAYGQGGAKHYEDDFPF